MSKREEAVPTLVTVCDLCGVVAQRWGADEKVGEQTQLDYPGHCTTNMIRRASGVLPPPGPDGPTAEDYDQDVCFGCIDRLVTEAFKKKAGA